MSMFCKFRHRGKSNVFIVISVGIVGAREWFMRFLYVVILVSLCAGRLLEWVWEDWNSVLLFDYERWILILVGMYAFNQ